jgi:hypothetical protein
VRVCELESIVTLDYRAANRDFQTVEKIST